LLLKPSSQDGYAEAISLFERAGWSSIRRLSRRRPSGAAPAILTLGLSTPGLGSHICFNRAHRTRSYGSIGQSAASRNRGPVKLGSLPPMPSKARPNALSPNSPRPEGSLATIAVRASRACRPPGSSLSGFPGCGRPAHSTKPLISPGCARPECRRSDRHRLKDVRSRLAAMVRRRRSAQSASRPPGRRDRDNGKCRRVRQIASRRLQVRG
jgi:hypothetical protein